MTSRVRGWGLTYVTCLGLKRDKGRRSGEGQRRSRLSAIVVGGRGGGGTRKERVRIFILLQAEGTVFAVSVVLFCSGGGEVVLGKVGLGFFVILIWYLIVCVCVCVAVFAYGWFLVFVFVDNHINFSR